LKRWQIKQASLCINRGGVIAYPTEAVYGLGCNPWNQQAVTRILKLKRRDPRKGLIIVAATLAQLAPFIENSPKLPWDNILSTWPGPVTWVLPVKNDVPVWLRGAQGGIAVRVSAYPVVRALCEAAGVLVSTSANPEGHPPARTAARVRAYFGTGVDYILNCPTGGRTEPTAIRHAASGMLLRGKP
jgi:L-threonylcarbamoyladenylate synthase